MTRDLDRDGRRIEARRTTHKRLIGLSLMAFGGLVVSVAIVGALVYLGVFTYLTLRSGFPGTLLSGFLKVVGAGLTGAVVFGVGRAYYRDEPRRWSGGDGGKG